MPPPSEHPDPFDARRFLDAQDRDGTFDRALRELSAGAKRSHWMWFVFPQLRGLGSSPTAARYALDREIPARDIVLESYSRITYENLNYAK